MNEVSWFCPLWCRRVCLFDSKHRWAELAGRTLEFKKIENPRGVISARSMPGAKVGSDRFMAQGCAGRFRHLTARLLITCWLAHGDWFEEEEESEEEEEWDIAKIRKEREEEEAREEETRMEEMRREFDEVNVAG